MSSTAPLPAFSAVGIELELMIVDADSLSVRPIADELLRAECGRYECEIERGDVAWSNELVAHLVELKTNGPRAGLEGLADAFQREVDHIQTRLEPLGARLLGTAMHPWMDPRTETQLWRHEYAEVYALFDRIFDCRHHGWANVQSVHINLPFADDDEFGRLHAAIRTVLPLLPALAASSPVVDGRLGHLLDNRLDAYRRHAAKIPEISGAVIPEPVYTRADYERLLDGIHAAVAPHDPDGVMRHEWINARGAIARFDRHAIEIRLLDVQETPEADMAIAAAVIAVVRALYEERFVAIEELKAWQTDRLKTLLAATARDGEAAVIRDLPFLELFRFPHSGPCEAWELWQHLLDHVMDDSERAAHAAPLERIFAQGTLARRIVQAIGGDRRRERLHEVYTELADCLASRRLFDVATP